MKDLSIIIISDSQTRNIDSNIPLLRNIDSMEYFSHDEFFSQINNLQAQIILIQTKNIEQTYLISQINKNHNFENTPIIAFNNSFTEEMLISIFDNGGTDYFLLNQSDTEILIKIMWGLKDKKKNYELELKNKILSDLNVIEPNSEFYTKQYYKQAMKNELDKQNSSYIIAISADIKYKNVLPVSYLAAVTKNSIRSTDVGCFAQDNKIYVILHKSNEVSANKIYEKISDQLGENYSISAAFINFEGNNIDFIEKELNKTLSNALVVGNTILFSTENKTIESTWLDKKDLKDANFKLFKQKFMDKFNKIVMPVFFQKQTILQQRLFETAIEQYINDKESLFSLEKSPVKSYILIKYPGFLKINFDIINTIGDKKTGERITLDISELSTGKVEEILEKLVTDFKENCKDTSLE